MLPYNESPIDRDHVDCAQIHKVAFNMAAFGLNSLKPTWLWSNDTKCLEPFMRELSPRDRERIKEHQGETTKRRRITDLCMQSFHKKSCTGA